LSTTFILILPGAYACALDATYLWVNVSGAVNKRLYKINKSTLSVSYTIITYTSRGIAVDDTYLYVAAYQANMTKRYLKTTMAEQDCPIGGLPMGMMLDATYYWMLTSQDSGSPPQNSLEQVKKSDLSGGSISVPGTNLSIGDGTGFAYDNYANS
jgi:hypothetical protein